MTTSVNDPILWIMSSSVFVVYMAEMWIAYLWAIKSFDLKWWFYEALWLGLLSIYCASIYLMYNNTIHDIKWKLVLLFYLNLFLNLLWTLYFAFGGDRFGRFMIAMLNVTMLSYNYTLVANDDSKNITVARSLLLPFIVFIFVGGMSFGLADIGSSNTKYITTLTKKIT